MLRIVWMTLTLLLLTACSSVQYSKNEVKLAAKAQWVLLPMVNHTQTSLASMRAESILQALMISKGITQLKVYPAELNNDNVFQPNDRKSVEQAMMWAKKEGAKYAVTGSVEEWQYKVGIDGEPVVGLTLKVIDLQSEQIVWTAVGAKSGWSRSPLSGIAQELMKEQLAKLSVE